MTLLLPPAELSSQFSTECVHQEAKAPPAGSGELTYTVGILPQRVVVCSEAASASRKMTSAHFFWKKPMMDACLLALLGAPFLGPFRSSLGSFLATPAACL